MGKDPSRLITEVEEEQRTRGELAKDALKWFLHDGNIGEMFVRSTAAEEISNELDISVEQANRAIADTVGDIVDPVQQISVDNEKHVGIIEYQVYESEGAYGYVDFDDRKGDRKRVVCAKCVEDESFDEHITHATQGEGTSNPNASWQQLLNKITAHYAADHDEGPSNVEPGASLVSGTTIAGNTAFHAGNENDITVIPTAVTYADLPDPSSLTEAKVYYVESQDDYFAVFQE